MNKKGFTLIELLITISLLALISVMVGVNITSILRSTEKNNEQFEKGQIEKAACIFADSEVRKESLGYSKVYTSLCGGNTCDILVNDLVASGLIPENYLEEYNNKKVRVTYTSNGRKECKLNS